MWDNPITDARSKPLTNLFRLQKAVVSSLSLDRVLDTVIAGAAEIAGGAPCALMLLQYPVGVNSSGKDNGNLTVSHTDLLDHRSRTDPYGQAGPPGDEGEGGILALHSRWGLGIEDGILIEQLPAKGSIFEKVLAGGKPVLISEVHSTGLLQLHQNKTARGNEIQSVLCCPLVAKGKRSGVLTIYCPRDTHLTEETIELLWLFAGQAAIAIQNARLYEEFTAVHEYTRNLIDSSLDMIMAVDKNRKLIEFNRSAEEAFGYTKTEVLGQHVDMLYADPANGLKAHQTAWETGQFTGVVTNKRKNGETFLSFLSASLLRNEQGEVVGIMGLSRDITEQKRLEEQLFQAQKMESIGTLAGGVAHDFNNLLTAVMGYAELVLREADIGARSRKYVAGILEQGRRAATLISQLMAFSRRAVTERQPLDLLPLVKQTMQMLERTIPETIAIQIVVPDRVSVVNADPTQMQQVIMNLCVNASHSMPDGGKLTLTLEDATLDEEYCRNCAYARPGKYVCLSVRDTGVGMTPEVQERIFEPFFTTKEVGEGTGLGLAMVYGIVKAHEGHIHVYSEVGEGSEFKIYLPVMEVSAAPQEVVKERPVGGTEKLLLVEDNATVLAVGRAMLESLGYTVLTATNGKEALEVYTAQPRHVGTGTIEKIALVLTDMVMPEMGGQELYEELAQINPEVKVLLASGYSYNERVADLRTKGLRGFVQKPFDFAKLARAVRQALDET